MKSTIMEEVTPTKGTPCHPHLSRSNGTREDVTLENSERTTAQRSEAADATVELMRKAFQAGATRITFVYGPMPEVNPIEAVIYVDNYERYRRPNQA